MSDWKIENGFLKRFSSRDGWFTVSVTGSRSICDYCINQDCESQLRRHAQVISCEDFIHENSNT